MKHKSGEHLKEHHVEIFLINMNDPVHIQLLRDSFEESKIRYIERHSGVSDFIIGSVANRNYGIDFFVYDADFERAKVLLKTMEFNLESV